MPQSSRQPVRTDPERLARRQAALSLWLLNLAAAVGIGTAYLRHLPEQLSIRGWVFVGFGLVSSVTILALVPGALSWLTTRSRRRAEVGGLAQAFLGASFLAVMKVDTVVFGLLRYHFFNSAVLNVALTRGSEDAVHLGGSVWWSVVIVLAALTGLEYWVWRRLYARALGRGSVRWPLWLRPSAAWGLLLIFIIGVDKSLYAAADLRGDREVSRVAELLPAYSPLRVSQLLPERLGAEGGPVRSVAIRPKGEPLDYPRAWPELPEGGARPNVLVLVVDSWRRDLCDDEVTPRLAALQREGRRFDDHVAAGNGTRFGIFSLLYGLPGSYWFSALEERRSPVLLDVLQSAGYEVDVYSSASMNFPEFRDTAWVECLDRVHDDHPYEHAWQRDLAVAERFREDLARRVEGDAPFFRFVLLDAAHQPYSSPESGPFEPVAEQLDYIELATDDSPELVERVLNRHRNALHFVDGLAADMIEALREAGELDETLVVVTGDHGEEFQENGFWGHTSNFTPEQVSVPFFLLGAGIQPGTETRPTSHLDLAPTLLEWMGADPARRGAWCLGGNLLEPADHRDRIVAGWEHVGLVTDDGIFRVRMGGWGPLDVEVFDRAWRPLDDAGARIVAHAESLERLAEGCRRFLLAPPAGVLARAR